MGGGRVNPRLGFRVIDHRAPRPGPDVKKVKLIYILKGETPGLWMAVSCPPGKTENTRRKNTRFRRDDALGFVRRQRIECKNFQKTDVTLGVVVPCLFFKP